MASIITADSGGVSGSAGIKQSADSSGILALATGTGTTAVTIDASQNVGIGTSSPTEKLQVSASSTSSIAASVVNTQSSTTSFISSTSTTYSFAGVGASTSWYGGSGAVALGNYGAFPIQFVTNGSERARIDSSGNLLLSTANTSLTVGSSSTQGASFATVSSGTSFSFACKFLNGNGAVGSITTSGSATAYNTSSDYRLKENIQPIQNALGVVGQLKPVTYTWKADGTAAQGFIAHELQEVVPDCVVGEKDAVEIYTDENGVEQTRPVYQGIDTSFLVATLTAAIQEQQALITTLTERISALEAK